MVRIITCALLLSISGLMFANGRICISNESMMNITVGFSGSAQTHALMPKSSMCVPNKSATRISVSPGLPEAGKVEQAAAAINVKPDKGEDCVVRFNSNFTFVAGARCGV